MPLIMRRRNRASPSRSGNDTRLDTGATGEGEQGGAQDVLGARPPVGGVETLEEFAQQAVGNELRLLATVSQRIDADRMVPVGRWP